MSSQELSSLSWFLCDSQRFIWFSKSLRDSSIRTGFGMFLDFYWILKWFIEMSDFSFQLWHRKGVSHHADELSPVTLEMTFRQHDSSRLGLESIKLRRDVVYIWYSDIAFPLNHRIEHTIRKSIPITKFTMWIVKSRQFECERQSIGGNCPICSTFYQKNFVCGWFLISQLVGRCIGVWSIHLNSFRFISKCIIYFVSHRFTLGELIEQHTTTSHASRPMNSKSNGIAIRIVEIKQIARSNKTGIFILIFIWNVVSCLPIYWMHFHLFHFIFGNNSTR